MPKALKRTDPRLLKALSDPLGETPDHTLGIYLLSAFGYTEKLPVYEVAPWTVRYQASPADLTDGRYAAALADIIGRPRVVVDSIVAVTADVSDRWARQLGQIDLARVLGAALSHGNPVIARLTDGSAFIDPRSIRALASATDFISAVQSGTWNIGTLTNITNPVTVQATDLDIRDLTTTERTPLGSQGQPLQQVATTYELKVKEQSPITGYATSAKQDTIIGYIDGVESLLAGGLPAALDTGALKVREQNPLTSINVATAEGTNIIIDKLTQTAFTCRSASISNGPSADTEYALATSLLSGKFFPRGCRGLLNWVYYRGRSVGGTGTVTLGFAPYPNGPQIATCTITLASSVTWNPLNASIWWNYDGCFIYEISSTGTCYGVYDTDTPKDGFCWYSNRWVGALYLNGAWTSGRIGMYLGTLGSTVGDVPVSGTLNTIGLPSSNLAYGQNTDIDTTAEQLTTTSTPCRRVRVKALASNAGTIYVGDDSSVLTTNGYALSAKDDVEIWIDDVSKIYVVASQVDQKACWIAELMP
jgi:hypothetical protein